VAKVFKVSDWFIPLARRLLYAWVRTSVFPENLQELGLDPTKPVCYVLQDRHLSNLLVLFEESRRAGLPRAEVPMTLGGSTCPAHSSFSTVTAAWPAEHATAVLLPLLASLIRQAVADPTLDVQLVPVVILWGRSPDQQDSSSRRCSRKPGARQAPGGNCWPSCCTVATCWCATTPDFAARSAAGRTR
jgi:glycerol-3-phosphate O-acyltransferase